MKIISGKGNIRTFKFGDKLKRIKPSKHGRMKFMEEIEVIIFKKIEDNNIWYSYLYEYTMGAGRKSIDLDEWEEGWKKINR